MQFLSLGKDCQRCSVLHVQHLGTTATACAQKSHLKLANTLSVHISTRSYVHDCKSWLHVTGSLM